MRILRIALPAAGLVLAAWGQTDWPTFGHDLAGTRYSTLKQIDTKNVGKLVRAWTYHMSADAQAATPPVAGSSEAGDAVEGGRGRGGRGGRGGGGRGGNSEVSPLIVNGVMYLTTGGGRVVALEPETAKEIWTYDVKDGAPATRGLEFWAGDKNSPAALFFGTSTGKLYALNAKTGKPVPGFGNEGIVDMKPGALNGLTNSSFGLSSPPIVYRNVVITGAHVQEGPSIGSAGDTRGWDVHSGKLLWTFHSVPRPGETGSDTWKGDDWKNRSGTNVWGMFTIDAERGILYMPFGEPTSDYWGGDRPGKNLFGTSLVAVDALTGKLKWYFQVVHHDTWDYDLCAPPILFDVVQKGKKIPAVGQLTKSWICFHPKPAHRRANLRRGGAEGSGGRCLARRSGLAYAADSGEATGTGSYQFQARRSGYRDSRAEQVLHRAVRQHSRRSACRSASSRTTPPLPA